MNSCYWSFAPKHTTLVELRRQYPLLFLRDWTTSSTLFLQKSFTFFNRWLKQLAGLKGNWKEHLKALLINAFETLLWMVEYSSNWRLNIIYFNMKSVRKHQVKQAFNVKLQKQDVIFKTLFLINIKHYIVTRNKNYYDGQQI